MKLLQLNVEESKLRLSSAQRDSDRVRNLAASGVMTPSEQRKAETAHAVARIAVERAELQFAPYAAIQKEMSELNPDSFDITALLKDPVVEADRDTEIQ